MLMALIGIAFLFVRWRINKPANFKIPEEKKYLVMGHSHAANAFNDAHFKAMYNASEAMEGYMYTYGKLARITGANPQIEAVFLEVTNNQFNRYAESRMWGEYMENLYPKHMATMDAGANILLLKKCPDKVIGSMPVALRSNLEFVFTGKNYVKEKWSEDVIPTETHFVEMYPPLKGNASNTGILSDDYGMCTESIWYLAKIAFYCKNNHIPLYFVRSPLLAFLQRSKEDGRFLEIVNREFPEIPFLDFAAFAAEKKEYCDEAHLNGHGSIRFTAMFERLLKNGLLQEKEKQAMIDKEIEKEDKSLH